LTPQNQKLRDCDDVLGVDILFRLVNIKQPDFSSLDSVVDALVASTIKSVVSRLKGQDIHAVVAAQAQEMQNQAMQNQAMQASSQASETDTRPDA
jgi:ribosomal protein L12E/L44/L45/RPP1/RPP2